MNTTSEDTTLQGAVFGDNPIAQIPVRCAKANDNRSAQHQQCFESVLCFPCTSAAIRVPCVLLGTGGARRGEDPCPDEANCHAQTPRNESRRPWLLHLLQNGIIRGGVVATQLCHEVSFVDPPGLLLIATDHPPGGEQGASSKVPRAGTCWRQGPCGDASPAPGSQCWSLRAQARCRAAR